MESKLKIATPKCKSQPLTDKAKGTGIFNSSN